MGGGKDPLHNDQTLGQQDSTSTLDLTDLQALITRIDPLLKFENRANTNLLFDLSTLASRASQISRVHAVTEASVARFLDEQGVSLWNSSIYIRHESGAEGDAKRLIAYMRRAATLLIEAGSVAPYDGMTLARLISNHSKAATALCEVEDLELAQELLDKAAEFEKEVDKLPTGDQPTALAKELNSALQVFYLARFDMGSRQGNEGIAAFTLRKAVELDGDTASQVKIAAKHVQHGSWLLRQALAIHKDEGKIKGRHDKAVRSIEWLQKGVKLLEHINVASLPHAEDVQVKALRALARAYFEAADGDSGNLDGAQATLEELMKVYKLRKDPRSSDERLYFLQLSILQKRKANDSELVQAIQALISHLVFNEASVNRILQEIRTLHHHRPIAPTCLHSLLERALKLPEDGGQEFVPRVLVSILTSVKATKNLDTARDALNMIQSAPSFSLPPDAVFACQMLLWKEGDSLYKKGEHSAAALLYKLAGHQTFKAMTQNIAKSLRKTALCHIQAGQHSEAAEIIRQCPSSVSDNAANHFVLFVSAIRSGHATEALAALDLLIHAPNFRSSMLLIVVQEAQEAGFSIVLEAGLARIAERLETDSELSSGVDALVLYRCLIKMHLPSNDPDSFSPDGVEKLLVYLDSTLGALKRAPQKDEKTRKEAEWLYKTAYNVAIELAGELTSDQTARLFEAAFELMKTQKTQIAMTPTPPQEEILRMMIWAKLGSIAGRSQAAREDQCDSEERQALFRRINADVCEAETLLVEARDTETQQIMEDVQWALLALRFEALARLQDWGALTTLLQEAHGRSVAPPTKVYETLLDILWAEEGVPEIILSRLVQKIMDVSLATGHTDPVKALRWSRALIELALESERPESLMEAICHLERALRLLERFNDGIGPHLPPRDEVFWMLSQAWNKGIELFNCACYEDAKRFCEMALALTRFEPRSTNLKAKMHAQYQQLLAKLDSLTHSDEIMSDP